MGGGGGGAVGVVAAEGSGVEDADVENAGGDAGGSGAGWDVGIDAGGVTVGSAGGGAVGVSGSVGVGGVTGGGDGGGGVSGVADAVDCSKSVLLMLNAGTPSGSRRTSVRSPSLEVGDVGCCAAACRVPPLLFVRRVARCLTREAVIVDFTCLAGCMLVLLRSR